MTYSPDHMLVHLTYRQQQLRQEADAYRRTHPNSDVDKAHRRVRPMAGRAAASLAGRIRRSLDSLTEWPRPV